MPFNLNYNQKADRKLLITAVNAGTIDDPEWEVVGRGVEESSIEFNPDVATVNDILGNTETDVNGFEMSQDLEPMTVRGGSKLALKIYDINKRRAFTEFSQFEVLLIFGYVFTPSNGFTAEKHINCTITPQSEGGDAHVDMPITITFSGDKELGLVDKLSNGMTFRKEEMVWIPAFRNCDVLDTDDTSLHPAFIVNGKPIDGFWYGKYEASDDGTGTAQSKYGESPWTNLTYDAAMTACTKKGRGWHMSTNAEWAAIALLSKKLGTVPKGNNNYGRDATEKEYIAEPATTGTDGKIHTVKTGTGPATWSSDGTMDGIWDMNGNASEFQGGIIINAGELRILENNDAADSQNSQATSASTWKSILPDGTLVEPGTDGTLKYDYFDDHITLCTERTSTQDDYHDGGEFRAMGTNGVSKVPLIAKALCLYPDHVNVNDKVAFNCGGANRIFARGGSYSGRQYGDTPYGIFNFVAAFTRSDKRDTYGFRLAYINI